MSGTIGMAEINSRPWWDNRGLEYLKKNDLRVRTREDETASHHVKGSIIEVGCAFGGFTKALGPEVQYIGIDLSETMIVKARELHPERIFVRQSLEEAVKFWGTAFTTACAFQLLEHFKDVKEPLKMLSRIASELIVFTVPRGLPENHQRSNDGHLIGWKDEDAVKNVFSTFGLVSFWKGNNNHICGVIETKEVGR